MKHFDEAARTYESYGFIQKEMADWLAEWCPASRSGKALEVAAGTGFFSRKLLPWSGHLIVSDAAPSMVEEGKRLTPGPDWVTAMADALPDEKFDWIFSSSFLQWADDASELLGHWRSRLTPGGRILAGLYINPTLNELV